LLKQVSREPIGRLIAATRRRIHCAVGRVVAVHGVRPQRFWILVNLREWPDLTLREIAQRLRMDEPTASRIIAGLVRGRLVRAGRDPRDARRRPLQLTPEGRALADRLTPIAADVRKAVEAGFTAQEKALLRGLLTRVMSNMDRLERRHTEKSDE
jgi:DNA-binding MarR family transcriptional regulator